MFNPQMPGLATLAFGLSARSLRLYHVTYLYVRLSIAKLVRRCAGHSASGAVSMLAHRPKVVSLSVASAFAYSPLGTRHLAVRLRFVKVHFIGNQKAEENVKGNSDPGDVKICDLALSVPEPAFCSGALKAKSLLCYRLVALSKIQP
jgi:hypothetical protein